MRVETASGSFDLGVTDATPTIGITDYSRRVTDDFGVTTVVKRGFSRRMSVRLGVPFDDVDALQRRLADLRATSARWVADESLAWLSAEGFFKDFSIDLAVPPLSFCTLTIEGLAQAETVTDDGGDPAPDGLTSTLRLLRPVVVNDAVLTASSIGENDYAQWSSVTTYPIGARVIRAAQHRIYESAIGGNVNHDPAGADGNWIDIGPTTRWAAFDQALGTSASGVGGISFDLTPDVSITGIALLDVLGTSVRVQAPGYDTIVGVDGGAVTFLDIATTPGQTIKVTIISGSGLTVAVGTLLIGQMVSLGVTEASPTAGITDYSLKGTDDFGTVTPVPRAWAKRMTANALIRTNAVDAVANRIASVRAQPSLWFGDIGLDALTVYGFFKEFSIEIGENVSKLSLSIEGLSKAAPLPVPALVYVPRGPYRNDLLYDVGDVTQFEGSSWEYIFRSATSGHAPPSLPSTENDYWRIFARAGDDGRDGLNGTNGTRGPPGPDGLPIYLHIAYSNSADGTADFTTTAPDSRKYLGILVDRTIADSQNPASYFWSLIRGADGLNGTNGAPGPPGPDGQPTYVHIAYANSADGATDFSADDPTGRTYIGFYVDQALADSLNPAAYTWSLVKGADGAGANQIVLSNFAQGLRGWRPGATNAVVTPYHILPSNTTPSTPGPFVRDINLPGWFGARQVPYAYFNGTLVAQDYLDAFWTPSQWSGDTFASGLGYMMPIRQGDTAYIRCLAAEHRCHFILYMLIFDGSGNLLIAPQFEGAKSYGAQDGKPQNFNEIGGFVRDIPANAAWAALMIRMLGQGEENPYIFFTEPAMGLASKGQAILPPYSDGPSDPLADITALNQSFMTQPDPVVIQADYQGNQVPGQFPIQLGIVRRLGAVNVSPNTVFNLGLGGNVQGNINNVAGSADRGLLTLTGPTVGAANGTVTVTSGYNDSYMTIQFTVSTNYAAAPVSGGTTPPPSGGGGGPSTVSTFTPPSTNTGYTLMATLAGVTVGSASSVMIAASLSFAQQIRRTAAIATNLRARITRSVNGGTETEVATQLSQEPASKYTEGSEPGNPNGGTVQSEPGSLTFSYNDGGIPASAVVVYKIYGVAEAASNGVNNVQGTFSATPG